MMAPYPWQAAIWSDLVQRWQNQKLPHALMLSGQEGLGKKVFADQFANLLLCLQPNGDQPCGQCSNCHLLASASHPDKQLVELEEGSQQIKVDQIRSINQFVHNTAQLGGYKVVIIDGAERLNVNAANSFLKTLEEPPGLTLMILVVAQSWRLPATIKSRCQNYAFQMSSQPDTLDWLQKQIAVSEINTALALAPGAPLKVVELLHDDAIQKRHDFMQAIIAITQAKLDPLKVAEQWHERLDKTLLNWLLLWIQDLIRIALISTEVDIKNSDYRTQLQIIANNISVDSLIGFEKEVVQMMRYIDGSLNKQLLLEALLIRWAQLTR